MPDTPKATTASYRKSGKMGRDRGATGVTSLRIIDNLARQHELKMSPITDTISVTGSTGKIA